MQQLDIKADILRNKELKQLGTRRASQARLSLRGDLPPLSPRAPLRRSARRHMQWAPQATHSRGRSAA